MNRDEGLPFTRDDIKVQPGDKPILPEIIERLQDPINYAIDIGTEPILTVWPLGLDGPTVELNLAKGLIWDEFWPEIPEISSPLEQSKQIREFIQFLRSIIQLYESKLNQLSEEP